MHPFIPLSRMRMLAIICAAMVVLSTAGVHVHLARAQSNSAAATPLSDGELAVQFRRVEVASVSQNLGNILRSAANEVIDLAPLFQTFEMIKIQEPAPARPLPSRQNHQQHRRRGRSSEVRSQRTEVRRQRSEVSGQRSDNQKPAVKHQ